jgi:uncharacterized protein YsxB (DUF464 family)
VQFVRGNYGYEEYHITGHAGYNPGNDIVCAATSALGFALIGSLQKMNGISFRQLQAEDGIDLAIEPFINDDMQKITDTIFMTIYIGLKQIEQAYPEHVQVSENTVL